jgi:hypothetical protein
MGVDFLVCKRCDDTFPDCGHFVRCDCWRKWCSEQCAEEDGFREGEKYEENGWKYDPERTCNYCRYESADDPTLLSFLLTELGLTREEVLKQWQASAKAK